MKRYIAVFSMLLAAVAGTASGQESVGVTWDGVISNPPTITTYLQGTPMNTGGNWHETGVQVPPYQVTISGDSLYGVNGTQSVYCLDLMSGVGSNGNYTLSALPNGNTSTFTLDLGNNDGGYEAYTLSSWRLQALDYLFGTFYTWTAGSASRALALAAWALVYDDPGATLAQFQSYGVNITSSSQNFYATGLATGDATNASNDLNAALAAVEAAQSSGNNSNIPDDVYVLKSTTDQDFAFAVVPTTVPEPNPFVRHSSLARLGNRRRGRNVSSPSSSLEPSTFRTLKPARGFVAFNARLWDGSCDQSRGVIRIKAASIADGQHFLFGVAESRWRRSWPSRPRGNQHKRVIWQRSLSNHLSGAA